MQSELVADVVVGRYNYRYVRGCPSRGNLFIDVTLLHSKGTDSSEPLWVTLGRGD